jgi:hypothetical protein
MFVLGQGPPFQTASAQPNHVFFAVDDLEGQIRPDAADDHVDRIRADVDRRDAHALQYRYWQDDKGMAHATTVNRDALAGVLRQQVQALRHHLPRAGRGRPRAVHQARVASRRLREALPVAAAAVPGVDLRREVRRITKALGRVREIDVALTEFDRSTKVSGWSGAIAQRVHEHLELERNQRERIMKARLNSLGGKRLDDRVKALAKAV